MNSNNSIHRDNEREGEWALSSTKEYGYEFDQDDEQLVELEPFEPEQISLIDKLMMGCGLLTLIVPVVLLLLTLILLGLAQQS